MTITINGFDTASINAAIAELKKVADPGGAKIQEACMKIARYGASRASDLYGTAQYETGSSAVEVVAEPTESGARVRASGENVLFIEYGAGALRGYGHPEPNGYGPGTFNPASDNWKKPNGWVYGHDASHRPLRSFGNPPTAAMYYAEQAMRDMAETIVDGELSK